MIGASQGPARAHASGARRRTLTSEGPTPRNSHVVQSPMPANRTSTNAEVTYCWLGPRGASRPRRPLPLVYDELPRPPSGSSPAQEPHASSPPPWSTGPTSGWLAPCNVGEQGLTFGPPRGHPAHSHRPRTRARRQARPWRPTDSLEDAEQGVARRQDLVGHDTALTASKPRIPKARSWNCGSSPGCRPSRRERLGIPRAPSPETGPSPRPGAPRTDQGRLRTGREHRASDQAPAAVL